MKPSTYSILKRALEQEAPAGQEHLYALPVPNNAAPTTHLRNVDGFLILIIDREKAGGVMPKLTEDMTGLRINLE